MKKRLIPILIALGVLITGCTANTVPSPAPERILIYRVLTPDYQSDGKLLQSETVAIDKSKESVLQAKAAISEKPQNESLQCPLPTGVIIQDAKLDENCVNVYMNSLYLDVSGIEKTIMNSCITMTMCSIKGVDFVTICVGSEVIEDKLSTEDFLLFDNIINSRMAQVRIYFPKTTEKILGSEYHTISFDDENSAERAILDTLLQGPTSNSLKRGFPFGTIVLSVYTQDGICSVSLSGISPDDGSLKSDEAKLAVYSIVNSLTSLAGIKSVQILIDGKQVQSIWGFSILSPLSKDESIIGSAVA